MIFQCISMRRLSQYREKTSRKISLGIICDILPRINSWASTLFLHFYEALVRPSGSFAWKLSPARDKSSCFNDRCLLYPCAGFPTLRVQRLLSLLSRLLFQSVFHWRGLRLQALASAVPQLSLGKQIHPTHKWIVGFLRFPKPLHCAKAREP